MVIILNTLSIGGTFQAHFPLHSHQNWLSDYCYYYCSIVPAGAPCQFTQLGMIRLTFCLQIPHFLSRLMPEI